MLNFNNTTKHHKGFSLIELIVGIVLLAMVMGILLTITLGGVKNGKFTQTLADVTILTSQKATELFNNVATEIKSIPVGQNYIGSIDPSEPSLNYTDYLNQSGCLIKKPSVKLPPLDKPRTKDGDIKGIKGVSKNGNGRGLGDIGNGDSDGDGDDGSTGDLTSLDCSKSPFAINSNSLTPTFRRQWIIVKNKPNSGDITIGVILVNQANNSIVRSETLVRVDGSSSKE
jgi:prepilin-type N-terminal cleavage/methylation domain-containing protein